MLRVLILSFLAGALGVAHAASPIYKWTDSAGTIHYEDQHPSEVDVEVLRSAEPYRGEPRDQAVDPAAVAAEQRQAKCEEKRAMLDQVLKAPRLYRLDAQGNRVYLSALEHQQYTEELRSEVALLCQ
jgi:hypothetical protein